MKVYKGVTAWGDSFQELADCWGEAGFCEVVKGGNQLSWLDDNNPDGVVMLHEYDRCNDNESEGWVWHVAQLKKECRLALFANEVPLSESPWIYWPRHIKEVTQVRKESILSYTERDCHSMFIGAAENPVQYLNRTKFDWSLAVDRFDFSVNLFSKTPHKYSSLEFLKLIKRARFGLCLEGYGPKCQRDIEYIANGVVPIFTWDTFNDYYNPLQENIHYLYARHPREAKEKIAATSKEKWQEMSDNCIEWFNKNCSIEGSFKTTMEITGN